MKNVMTVIKKNLFSIILGVIALLAVAGSFYPLGGMVSTLKAEAASHAEKAVTLKGLNTKQHNLPVVVPGSTETVLLPGFPTKAAVEVGHQATGLVAAAADKVVKTSSDLNIHKPLVDDALPGVMGNALAGSRFARYYVAKFPPPAPAGGVPAAVAVDKPPGAGPTLIEMLRAGMPPSNLDMDAKRLEKQKQIEEENTQIVNGQPANLADVQALVQAGVKQLGDTMRREAAEKCLVYVAPDAFAPYTGMISTAQNIDPTNIFWAQIGLWVQEDICHAIFSMNSKFKNVTEAPVKQVVKISFVTPGTPNSGGGGSSPGSVIPVFVVPGLPPSGGVGTVTAMPTAPGGDPSAGPAPLIQPGDPNAALTKNPLMSPTGRQSNALFDVVQFDVELIVDAASVPQVLESLGAKQYISVAQVMSIDTVDSAYFRGGGYYFGEKPCARIKARCEELFFRSWLEKYVPTGLKTLLGYPAPAPPAPPA